jgi:hypothetical protein
LKKEAGVFYFDQVVHVAETRLHHADLALDGVVAVSDTLSNNLLVRCLKLCGKEFQKLVFHILDEV